MSIAYGHNEVGNDYTEAVIATSAGSRQDRATAPIGSADSIDWYSFLERPRLPSPSKVSLQPLRDASILLTGAGGSIGRALSLRLAALRPRQLVLLDASEQALFRLQSELKADIAEIPTLVLANIANRAAIEEIFTMHQPSLVFHAAAHKHVALLEEHPLAAIENNVLGTETLLEAAHGHAVRRVVLLSTDKAVEPVSILGATKQIAEQIALARNGIVVRLANVLGTEGSVVDILLRSIDSGEAILIRNRLSERYFLTTEEAVDLLLSAAANASPGSLLIPRLDRGHRIVALVDFLISRVANGGLPPIKYSELCPGEKVCESMHSEGEPILNSTSEGLASVAPAYPKTSLTARIAALRLAVEKRNLAAALELILLLAPDYTPSATVRSLALARGAGALQR